MIHSTATFSSASAVDSRLSSCWYPRSHSWLSCSPFHSRCGRRQSWLSPSWPESWSPCNTCYLEPIGSCLVSGGCSGGSVRVLAGYSRGVTRWNLLGRRRMVIHQNRRPMLQKTRSLDTRRGKMRRKDDKVPLGNVIPIIMHDSNVIPHMYTLATRFFEGRRVPRNTIIYSSRFISAENVQLCRPAFWRRHWGPLGCRVRVVPRWRYGCHCGSGRGPGLFIPGKNLVSESEARSRTFPVPKLTCSGAMSVRVVHAFTLFERGSHLGGLQTLVTRAHFGGDPLSHLCPFGNCPRTRGVSGLAFVRFPALPLQLYSQTDKTCLNCHIPIPVPLARSSPGRS